MVNNKIGYACISMQLSYPTKYGNKPKGTKPITTNRSMIKRTFESKGIDYASEICLENVKDLHKIVSWNIMNGYDFFRMSSDMAPWKTEYDWSDLKDIDEIKKWFHSVGVMAHTHGVRLTTHPGPFNVLVSPHDHVIENCIKDLSIHGDEMDFMMLSRTPYNKINIHLGGVYGDKESAMDRFCKNFEEQEALEMAISTWGDIKPVVHYSESRSIEQLDESIRPQAHSDYVLDYIDTYGHEVDIMVEAKHKELAVNKYKELHNVL